MWELNISGKKTFCLYSFDADKISLSVHSCKLSANYLFILQPYMYVWLEEVRQGVHF